MNYIYDVNEFSFTDDQIKFLINELEKRKPTNICEFGVGVTTSIFEQYLSTNPDAKLISIEHDPTYRRKNTVICELAQHESLVIGNYNFDNANYYRNLNRHIRLNKYDFVVIDGPFSWELTYDFTRVQMLCFSEYKLLKDNSIVIVHDVQRPTVMATCELFEKSLTNAKYEYEKEYIVNDDAVPDYPDKDMIIYRIKKSAS